MLEERYQKPMKSYIKAFRIDPTKNPRKEESTSIKKIKKSRNLKINKTRLTSTQKSMMRTVFLARDKMQNYMGKLHFEIIRKLYMPFNQQKVVINESGKAVGLDEIPSEIYRSL